VFYLDSVTLTEREKGWLKKTSIDYTLCDELDKPIICIEFDGMQQGFNIGRNYHTDIPSDQWRKTIFELKLNIAHSSSFPMFIFNSDCFKNLSNEIKLTAVDAIIGEVLVNLKWYELTKDDSYLKEFNYGHIDDGIFCDPSVLLRTKLQREINSCYKIYKKLMESFNIFDSDNHCNIKYLQHPTNVSWDDVTRLGIELKISSKKFGKSRTMVWLPNLKTVGLDDAYEHIERIAWVVALSKLLNRNNR